MQFQQSVTDKNYLSRLHCSKLVSSEILTHYADMLIGRSLVYWRAVLKSMKSQNKKFCQKEGFCFLVVMQKE